MKHLRAALMILLLAAGCSERIDMESRLGSLVEAERAFAATSVEIGNRRAFLTYFADDAILFRPHAMPSREYLLEQPDDASLLTWLPVYADISRSGDLGYTTGPWEYRANGPEDPQVIHGHYVSVWMRQPDGAWKVVIDTGTSNPPPESTANHLVTGSYEISGAPAAQAGESGRLALMNRDRAFSVTAREKGLPDAFAIFAHDDIRLLRSGAFPVIGREAAAAVLNGREEVFSWEPAEARIARAGDMGYIYGQADARAAADSSVNIRYTYMRIWKQSADGTWKVVIDVMNPLPGMPSNQ